MNSSGIDPSLAMQAAQNQDLIQKRMQVDALRERLTPSPDGKAKLREACQGFETIFIQKMWDQMRKNVPQEGYLHSKQEAMYQSMFDQEFSKKMSEAGGIGLGDMLYEQLAQTLGESSRSVSPGVNPRLPVVPASDSPSRLNYSAETKPAIKPLYQDAEDLGGLPLKQGPAPLNRNPFGPPDVQQAGPLPEKVDENEALPFDPALLEGMGPEAAGKQAGLTSAAAVEFNFEALSQALLLEELSGLERKAEPGRLNNAGNENAAARKVKGRANAQAAPAGPVVSGLTPQEAQILSDALRENQDAAVRALG